jgi:hypothetical protein
MASARPAAALMGAAAAGPAPAAKASGSDRANASIRFFMAFSPERAPPAYKTTACAGLGFAGG